MSEEKIIRIRLSDDDLHNFEICQKVFGKNKSEIARIGINNTIKEIEKSKNIKYESIYVETLQNKNTGYKKTWMLNKEKIISAFMRLISGNSLTARSEECNKKIDKIESGKTVSFPAKSYGEGYEFTYRLATEEEIKSVSEGISRSENPM